MSTLNFDEWYQRIEPEIGNSELKSDGQPRFPHLIYEQAFARNVLARIDGIDFAQVHYQRRIEIGGNQYRIDFTIEEPGHVPIAIEIDGTRKYDGGTRQRTTTEHKNEIAREHAIQGEGFLVVHFANVQVRDAASDCRDHLTKVIAQARSSDRSNASVGILQAQIVREDYETTQRRLADLEGRGDARSEEHQQTLERISDLEELLKGLQTAPSASPASPPNRRGQLLAAGAVGAAAIVVFVGLILWRASAPSEAKALCDRAEPVPANPQLLVARQGERMDLRGSVIDIAGSGGVTYLNVNAEYQQPGHFAFVVPGSQAGLDAYEGHDTAATGVIDLGKQGQPQLKISDPTSITVCD